MEVNGVLYTNHTERLIPLECHGNDDFYFDYNFSKGKENAIIITTDVKNDKYEILLYLGFVENVKRHNFLDYLDMPEIFLNGTVWLYKEKKIFIPTCERKDYLILPLGADTKKLKNA